MDLLKWYEAYVRLDRDIRSHLSAIEIDLKQMRALKEELDVRISHGSEAKHSPADTLRTP